MFSWLSEWKTVIDWLFPRICPGCRRHSDREGRLICWGCFSSISLFTESLCDRCGRFVTGQVQHRFICSSCVSEPPAYDRARAAAHFGGFLRELLHRFKYQKGVYLCEDLADLLEGTVRAHFDAAAVDVVVPVPLHPLRLRARSYNQAALLAESLGRRLGRRVDTVSLQRVRFTGTQTRLHRAARRENMKGAFSVARPAWLRHRTVLLVDDVMTTGATFDACARALKKAGVWRVWCVAVARGE